MTSTNSSTPAAGADFSQLSTRVRNLALAHDIEIVGCAKGFSALKDGEIISGDCTNDEMDLWLTGYARGQAVMDAERTASDAKFTDIEFNAVLDHVRYRGWALQADHTGTKVSGPGFVTHVASAVEFFAFTHGFNAAGAALGMLGTGAPSADGDD